MEKSIYKYILNHSLRDQIVLVVLTFLAFPLIYAALEIPKIIINEAISGENVPESLLGFEMDQISYLLTLCFVLLGLVLINGAFKYVLNVYSGVLGERMLRRFRYELYSRILRFPLPHFKHVSQGEIIPMITAETEPLGGFIGDSFTLPAFQGGLLITYLFFIFNQDPMLGLAAIAIYPVQMAIIPRLQKKVNALSKERVLAVRSLADKVGESVAGVSEIHAHDTSQFERAKASKQLGKIYGIRYQIYRLKFFVKFLNNFLTQITPFFFYSIGGYFVIRGDLSLGALIAVLAAYKDLASPWNELLKYYQIKEDVKVKYAQIIEQFHPQNILDEMLQDDEPDGAIDLTGDIRASNLSYCEDGVNRTLDAASFTLPGGAHTALLGHTGSGKDEVARLIARLISPSSGSLTVNGVPLNALPESVVGRRIAYVGPDSFIFSGSLRDNLYYGLKHRALADARYSPEELKLREREIKLSRHAGNSLLDPLANWLDYSAAGVAQGDELEEAGIRVLTEVGLANDVFQLGLRSRISPEQHRELTDRILEARARLLEHAKAGEGSRLIESFDPERYNSNASVAENLLFGTLRDSSLSADALALHPYIKDILRKTGLLRDLEEVGRKVAETMLELFADLPPGHEFFEQFSFISSDDLPGYRSLLTRISRDGINAIETEERGRLLSLAFKMIPAQHRLGLVDEPLQVRLLEARKVFADELPEDMRSVIEFFEAGAYNAASTVQDNILFGKPAYGIAESRQRVLALIDDVIDQLDLRGALMRVGLDFNVGKAGTRLAPSQRQKLAIARCLLKRPDILIVNEATSALDGPSETALFSNLCQSQKGRTVICVLNRSELAKGFDQVMVMQDGKVSKSGASERPAMLKEVAR